MVKTSMILVNNSNGKKFPIFENRGRLVIKSGNITVDVNNLINSNCKVVSK